MAFDQDEMDALFPGGALRALQTPSTTLDEVLKTYARLPLDRDECLAFLQCLLKQAERGRAVSQMPLDPQLRYASREERMGFFMHMADRGLAFVTAWDLDISLLLLKTNAGRSFFGKQRASYACLLNDMSGRLDPCGVYSSIAEAFGVLDRVFATVARA